MFKLKDILKRKGISRNFLIYFFISITLIFTIVFSVQWYVISWFVQRHEHDRITDVLIKIKASLNEHKEQHKSQLMLLKDIFIEYNQNTRFRDILLSENLPPNTLLYVLDSNGVVFYGYDWEFFLNQINEIKRPVEFFILSDRTNLYNVSSYRHILNNENEYYDFYFVSAYHQPQQTSINFRSYTLDNLLSSSDRSLKAIYNKIMNSDLKSDILVYPLDNIISVGLLLQYDLYSNPSVVYVYQYPREVHFFFRKFMLLIIFITLSFMVILTTISSAIISKKIFYPLWNLVDKMKSISEKPDLISPLNQKTHGEILQIYEYFNNMSMAVLDYQKQLKTSFELLEKINVGIFWLDSELKIKLYNKAFDKLLETHKLDNALIWDVFPCENKRFIDNKLEIDVYYLDHLEKQVSISIHSFTENDVKEYFGIVYDITERQKQARIRRSLEFELVRINRLGEVGRRIQGIVHNLNTPLNSIIGFAQLLYEDNPNNSDLKRIILSAKNMSLIIKQLLQKTKDDSIAMPMFVNINDLIKQELSFCTHDLSFKHNVGLELSLSDDLPSVRIVYGDISQVFQTLFNNAIEAMVNCDLKKLMIRTFKTDDMIAFSVKDTGTGISDEVMSYVFEPSFSTKELTQKSGFGLGLPLAKAIIDKLNGDIKIISEEGKGAEFIVYIPI